MAPSGASGRRETLLGLRMIRSVISIASQEAAPGCGRIPSREVSRCERRLSGAEIQPSIVARPYTAFSAKQQLSGEILAVKIQGTRPLGVTREEDVETIREWAKTRAVPAG